MGKQFKEMENKLSECISGDWRFGAYISPGYAECIRAFYVEFGDILKPRERAEFATLEELYEYVMSIPAKNPVLYRQFSLEEAA